uniref:Calreticulin n=1 Tax=Trieres chinensis TaxID=1514140 RepID=A0A7S1ZF32_TRICV|mmetsp:Transcript_23844/g.48277  ORF Transcript_23844/g.48277 Transcript_23844/m.48277 type:complete len:400 (+) Transcript_23844:90-1289(+)|eukprot:CAMPEP_0183299758 /NCGR_PEP_ID=MMETSP0160_2-20130417/6395_1 /TAXON_ID=2839 ORGANISM="Odontella Sinensis, Strain Grunow 1884" /NCGR_SAMPLE_ID=MMETSP0160_2 /ASSEMBLY_ACC=CAM_ASM_000250 /LENGTH=399 /DNA_ID=CAMNT_0025462059 /DNA_START=90 /DNA_END=1289 /DNA_ORIENTATION=-
MRISTLAALALASVPASAEVYFKEQFNDDGWKDRWTESSDWKPAAEMGEWKHTAGKWYGDEADKGIQTGPDARFFGISAKMDKVFDSSDGKDLVIQYSVKHEQSIDCGGAYIKLLPGGDSFASAKFGGDTKYAVMFGPDICGSSNKKTHTILHYEKKADNLLIKKEIPCENDQLSHLYTLVVRPDNTFEVFVDNKSVRSGKLEDQFDFLPPKEIKDPEQSKPDDWVDEREIVDPEDVKPEGYDDIPEEIPDPDASKPDDWDDEDDGEWEPPMVDNPEYNGPWSPKMIPNPEYKGRWEHPKIANPEYAYDDKMHAVCEGGCTHVGFELWQVKTGTIFDDIIVTDSLEEAQKFAEDTFFKKKDGEKKMFDDEEEEKRKQADMDMPDDDDMDDMDDGFGDEF